MSTSISRHNVMQLRTCPISITEKLTFVLPYADWRSWPEAALTAMSGGLGIYVGAITTPRAQHIAQLVAVQLNFLDREGDVELVAAYLQEVRAVHCSSDLHTHSEVMVYHSLFPSEDYMDCQAIGLLFVDMAHWGRFVVHHIATHQDVQSSESSSLTPRSSADDQHFRTCSKSTPSGDHPL